MDDEQLHDSYFDQYGLLSDESPARTVENNSLWTIIYFTLGYVNSSGFRGIYPSVKEDILRCRDEQGLWHVSPDHSIMPEEGFSRDNMISVVSLGLLEKDQDLAGEGMRCWTTRYAQPQDTAYFAYAANKWYGKLLLPIVLLNMLGSCWSQKKCGMGVLDTDGKILTFLRITALFYNSKSFFAGLYLKLLVWILEKRLYSYLDANIGEVPWFAVHPEQEEKVDRTVNIWRILFAMYFKDPNHPINMLAGEMWP